MGKDLANRLDKNVEKRENKEGTVTLEGMVKDMEAQFRMALPKGREADQFVRDALTAIRRIPKLKQCEWTTVIGSFMTAAQLGLRPNLLGQCYVLPYWNNKNKQLEAQFQFGYPGLLELAYRSGHLKAVAAKTVYTTDEFRLEHYHDRDEMVHIPDLDNQGSIRLFYARGLLQDGGYALTTPMSVKQMEKFRDDFASTKTKEGKVFGPWVDHFEAMSHKTMLIRLLKLLPKSTELEIGTAVDETKRIHVPGQEITPLNDLPGDVSNVIDSEAEEIGSKADAIALRDEVFAATNTAQVQAAMTKGERQGLLDLFVTNENGDEEELRLIVGRRASDLL